MRSSSRRQSASVHAVLKLVQDPLKVARAATPHGAAWVEAAAFPGLGTSLAGGGQMCGKFAAAHDPPVAVLWGPSAAQRVDGVAQQFTDGIGGASQGAGGGAGVHRRGDDDVDGDADGSPEQGLQNPYERVARRVGAAEQQQQQCRDRNLDRLVAQPLLLRHGKG